MKKTTMLEEQTKVAEPEQAHDTIDRVLVLFTDGSRSASLVAWADERGVERAVALLASALARASDVGQAQFLATFLHYAHGEGRNAARWLMWLWSEAPTSIRDRLFDQDDVDLVERAIDMYRRIAAGGAIDSGEWRTARRQLAIALSPSASAAAVESISAAMWDLGTTPGAIADAACSWITQTAVADAFEPSNWTRADYERVTRTWDEYGIEHARQNRKRADETDDAFHARISSYMQDHPVPLTPEDMALWGSWKEHHQRLMTVRTAELRGGLLEIMAA
jgi:hypothetical protein